MLVLKLLVSRTEAGAAMIPVSPDETVEELGPYHFIQKKSGHRLTQDTVLLADFLLPLSNDDSVIDLGTGTGAIPLLLSWKSTALKIVGVEVEEGVASIARRNVELNDLASRVTILKSDFRDLKSVCPEGSFSIVVSNPPYVKAGSGRLSPVKERALARAGIMGDVSELIDASRRLAGKDGRIFYIFPVSRLFEMLKEVKKAGLKARRLRFVHTNPKKAAKLFLIEIGTEGELKIEEPVYL